MKIRRLIGKNPCNAKIPLANKRVSPGKKKPKNRPDSEKIIRNIPSNPTVLIISSESNILVNTHPRENLNFRRKEDRLAICAIDRHKHAVTLYSFYHPRL
jgi:hypothetical protein